MKAENVEEIRNLLKTAMHPATAELRRDLWPELLRRMDAPQVQLPWFDWAMVALVAIWCMVFPSALLGLLYHL